MSGEDILGLVLETLILLGLVSAAVCLVIWLLMRAASSAMLETTAIILPADELASARWMADDGRLYSRELAHHEHDEVGTLESVTVYYSRRSPETIRFARHSEAERAVFVLFAITAGIGIASFVASMILLVVEG
ncbi:hypothetical protein GCM10027413_04920 [Conyzicola nivalis]|uniref:Uncharacterized protein n=1 Tax=Conyzicola nivalis TaxID=1477021 RepID=A0A916SM00_9MICO|nr:hypothetical protein [Conyzicola nivalis]GGB06829.1 hypothetical protein GCM10010979_21710 [Conyzicola nivalis]